MVIEAEMREEEAKRAEHERRLEIKARQTARRDISTSESSSEDYPVPDSQLIPELRISYAEKAGGSSRPSEPVATGTRPLPQTT